MSDYDVVVIGAGNAGLTAAVTLAKGGKNVLLLEKHNVPGGCGTSFRRGRFEFEVALHQLSGMGTDNDPFVLRRLFVELGINNQVEWVKEHDLYRTFVPGVLDITLPANRQGCENVLINEFPTEKDSILRFINLLYEFTGQYFGALIESRQISDVALLQRKYPLFFKYGLLSTKNILDQFFRDKRLTYVLGSYWAYLGLPPSQLRFADMAMMLYSYIEHKPYHVKGGSQAMSSALLDVFLSEGGDVKFNCGVEKIHVKNGRAYGVVTEQGEDIRCDFVVSNASSIVTYNDLIDANESPETARLDLKSQSIGTSGFVLHMGLDCNPEDVGFTTSTNFFAESTDEDALFRRVKTLDRPLCGLATCYDLENPTFSPKGACHLSLMTLQYGKPWLDVRPEDYADTKDRYADQLINLAERNFPGIRDNIEEVDIATPITIMRYLGHPGGAIYGFENTAGNSEIFRNASKPLIDGLFLAGAWTGNGGFQPTFEVGNRVGKTILKLAS